jgi:two-component system response regulator GlrR
MSKQGQRILLVDDDPGLLTLLGIRLRSYGYVVDTAANGQSALAGIATSRPALVISDLRMDEMDGIALLNEIHGKYPGLPVIMLTAHGTIPEAVKATQQGAFGFLTKPINKNELLAQIERAMQSSAAPVHEDEWRAAIITGSPLMIDLLDQVKRVAETDSSVLICGASGTGKELVALALHRASRRANGAFVPINCGAIPENLLEAELFGYERGAFTGAVRKHPGLLLAADGGTLFLDEIGDMPMHLQVKLLRVLQERCVRPVGGVDDTMIDVRVVSATHRDLEAAIKQGTFREDFYYRLKVVELKVPDLRDRCEDIPLLVQHALNQLTEQRNLPRKVYAPEALELLVRADWPGNVRQLLNIVEQNVALSPGPVISATQVEKALGGNVRTIPSFNRARDEFTRNYLIQLLQLAEGNVTRAARLAKRNRTDFYKLLNKYELTPARFKVS